LTSKPEELYGRQRSQMWTRIDMLLSLYDKAISNVEAAIEANQKQDEPAERGYRTTAIRMVLGIAAGLDLAQGDIPKQIARLCDFMHNSLANEGVESLQATKRVLMTLHEAFDGIQDEARELEVQGKIPRFSLQSTLEVSV